MGKNCWESMSLPHFIYCILLNSVFLILRLDPKVRLWTLFRRNSRTFFIFGGATVLIIWYSWTPTKILNLWFRLCFLLIIRAGGSLVCFQCSISSIWWSMYKLFIILLSWSSFCDWCVAHSANITSLDNVSLLLLMSDVSDWLSCSLGEIVHSLHDSIDWRHVNLLRYLTWC